MRWRRRERQSDPDERASTLVTLVEPGEHRPELGEVLAEVREERRTAARPAPAPPRAPRTAGGGAGRMIAAVAGLAVVVTAIAFAAVLRSTDEADGNRSILRLKLADLEPVSFYRIGTVPVFVVRRAAGPDGADAVDVFLGRSTHLNHSYGFCPSSRFFESRIHGEKWRLDGSYAAGPAPSDLDRVGFTIVGDELVIDAHAIIRSSGRTTPEDPQEAAGAFCLQMPGSEMYGG